METYEKMAHNTSYGVGKHPRFLTKQNTNSCKNMKLRMVIGGWTYYYVNHSDDWAAFNVHGTRVNVLDNDPNGDLITFQWDFTILTVPVGNIIKALRMIDNWLEE